MILNNRRRGWVQFNGSKADVPLSKLDEKVGQGIPMFYKRSVNHTEENQKKNQRSASQEYSPGMVPGKCGVSEKIRLDG